MVAGEQYPTGLQAHACGAAGAGRGPGIASRERAPLSAPASHAVNPCLQQAQWDCATSERRAYKQIGAPATGGGPSAHFDLLNLDNWPRHIGRVISLLIVVGSAPSRICCCSCCCSGRAGSVRIRDARCCVRRSNQKGDDAASQKGEGWLLLPRTRRHKHNTNTIYRRVPTNV